MSIVRRALEPHPESQPGPVRSLQVEAARQGGRLLLSYRLEGRLGELSIPPKGPAGRADDLWRHTCFEAFVRPPGDAAYWEFNLSPSCQWAAYGFSRYRQRGTDPKVEAPRIQVAATPQRLDLKASLDLTGLKGAWLVGVSAVIEGKEGGKSYWALRHPPGRPDFHHARGFVLTLDPP
ncbi:MAG: DOMON-like domain-containing protein [Pseudomonadota bacterium]|jgi:hypothetical protein